MTPPIERIQGFTPDFVTGKIYELSIALRHVLEDYVSIDFTLEYLEPFLSALERPDFNFDTTTLTDEARRETWQMLQVLCREPVTAYRTLLFALSDEEAGKYFEAHPGLYVKPSKANPEEVTAIFLRAAGLIYSQDWGVSLGPVLGEIPNGYIPVAEYNGDVDGAGD